MRKDTSGCVLVWGGTLQDRADNMGRQHRSAAAFSASVVHVITCGALFRFPRCIQPHLSQEAFSTAFFKPINTFDLLKRIASSIPRSKFNRTRQGLDAGSKQSDNLYVDTDWIRREKADTPHPKNHLAGTTLEKLKE